MKIDKIIPEPTAVLREAIIVLGGVLSKFPALQSFVASNSVTVKKDDGTILY
jgi:hypothetical protein